MPYYAFGEFHPGLEHALILGAQFTCEKQLTPLAARGYFTTVNCPTLVMPLRKKFSHPVR